MKGRIKGKESKFVPGRTCSQETTALCQELIRELGENYDRVVKIVASRGGWSFAADGVSELASKLAGAANGYGRTLHFDDEQTFLEKLSGMPLDQRIRWMADQARSRLAFYYSKSKEFYDGEAETMNCSEEIESVANEATDESSSHPGEQREDNAEIDEPKPKRTRNKGKKVSAKNRVFNARFLDADARSSNYFPCPGADLDRKIQWRAALSVLDELHRHHNVSDLAISIFLECVVYRRDRREVSEEYGLKRNATDQLLHRLDRKLRKCGPAIFAQKEKELFFEAEAA